MKEWKERKTANIQFLTWGIKTNRYTLKIAAEKGAVVVARKVG